MPTAETSRGDLLTLRYQWHPRLREVWARERLYFWWLSGFSAYDRTAILEKLSWVLTYNNVSAYAIYELYGGGYDILLRAWLTTSQRPFTQTLQTTFDASLIVEHFSVDDIVSHWPWMDHPGDTFREPDPAVLELPLSPSEIRAINTQDLTQDQCFDYEQRNIVAPVPHQQGVKFVTLISSTNQSRSLDAWEKLRQQLIGILDRADTVSERSLYHGSGFGRFLILGRVAYGDYHEIARKITEPINDTIAPGTFGSRTTTFLVSTEDFLAFSDQMRLPESSPPERPAADLLDQEESHLLEVKGSAFVDINRLLNNPGSSPEYSDDIANSGVLRAITGMLNADGGTIVIGALEQARYSRYESLGGLPRWGEYLCCGLEYDYLGHGWDQFERRLRQLLHDRIRDNTSEWVRITRDGVGSIPMCVVTVTSPERRKEQRNRWFYHYPKGFRGVPHFWVRQGNRTIELQGPDIDDYKDDKTR